jgi:hypothetical protein
VILFAPVFIESEGGDRRVRTASVDLRDTDDIMARIA